MIRNLIKTLLFCLTGMILMTAVISLIYITDQQNIRQSANDPQLQLSEDIASVLGKGIPPSAIASSFNQINIKTSLSAFVIIYDINGNVLASSGQLGGQVPIIPKGVLEHAKEWGQNRRTWEPQDDVRIATVTTPFSASNQSGYVLVGRSLRELEKRELKLRLECIIVWLGSMFLIVIMSVLSAIFSFRVRNNN